VEKGPLAGVVFQQDSLINPGDHPGSIPTANEQALKSANPRYCYPGLADVWDIFEERDISTNSLRHVAGYKLSRNLE
jgi:hypothetical protein